MEDKNPVDPGRARYDYYRLYRLFLETDSHVKMLQELELRSDSYTFYGHARAAGQKLTIMVAAHKIGEFIDLMSCYQLKGEVLDYNIQQKIDNELKTIQPPSTSPEAFDWKHYFHLDTINKWLDFLCAKYDYVTPVTLGKSYEGLPIKGVKLARNLTNPTIFVEGGIHAREWISPATATYILSQLLTSTDPDIIDLSTNFNWIFLPCVNPDGYRYTFTTDRLWRKSRQPNGLYRGADLNRNFDIDWNGSGASSDTSSYDYAGSSPFSEPEAKAIADFLTESRERENICIYIALHSYSQLVMFPLGHTPEPIDKYDQHKTICEKACKAIKAVHGREYKFGSKHETIYPSSGGSIDWAYMVGEIPVSITFELRGPPDSPDMFILPAEEITPTGEETVAAFVTIAKEARRLKLCNGNL